MAAGNVSLRYLILGLLIQKPMSGYDIKSLLKSFGWLIGSPSFGSLYPALRALLEDGLVTVEGVPHQEKRPRKIYSVTEAGKQALQGWIDLPVLPDASLKSFIMRLVLADSFSTAGLIAYLQQRRAQVSAHQAALKRAGGALEGNAGSGQRLAFDYGLALATAEMAWLDSMLDQLSRPLPMEVPQGGSVLSAV
jgi:DNA-binding PadR family transcriptional regulator